MAANKKKHSEKEKKSKKIRKKWFGIFSTFWPSLADPHIKEGHLKQ